MTVKTCCSESPNRPGFPASNDLRGFSLLSSDKMFRPRSLCDLHKLYPVSEDVCLLNNPGVYMVVDHLVLRR